MIDLWNHGYYLRPSMLPSFLPLPLARRIFLIGKSICFTRLSPAAPSQGQLLPSGPQSVSSALGLHTSINTTNTTTATATTTTATATDGAEKDSSASASVSVSVGIGIGSGNGSGDSTTKDSKETQRPAAGQRDSSSSSSFSDRDGAGQKQGQKKEQKDQDIKLAQRVGARAEAARRRARGGRTVPIGSGVAAAVRRQQSAVVAMNSQVRKYGNM